MLGVFDKVDEDETGFAPRLDLRREVDKFIEAAPRVQELSDMIRAMDVMILEREDFQDLVMEWLNASA